MIMTVRAPERLGRVGRLFLAGGISGCPDWQTEMIALLDKMSLDNGTGLIVYNPRRENFNLEDQALSREQIAWEFYALRGADMISFWFPKETLCPITLFELGKMASSTAKIFVGCEPGYQRAEDVKIQMSLQRPSVKVADSLEGLAKEVMYAFNY